MSKRKQHFHEGPKEPPGEGTWLMSYADMITLLLAFFIILVSASTPNEAQFAKVSDALTKAVKVEVTVERPLDGLVEKLKGEIKKQALDQHIKVEYDGLTDARIIFMGTFFLSAKAEFKEELAAKIGTLAVLLKNDVDKHFLLIEGHTDNVPIKSNIYPSNWELSSARASSIARFFIENGMPSDRLQVIGFSDTLPRGDNTTEEGRASNRRIEIVLSKKVIK